MSDVWAERPFDTFDMSNAPLRDGFRALFRG
jgi:hypothetical protein